MGNNAKGIFGSLPILAAAFGRERGITVGIGGPQAYVQGKHIQLPTLPIESDEELEIKAMGFLFHETGHLEFTDTLVKLQSENALQLSLYRAIEDVRMEAARNATYPGSARSLAQLVDLLTKEGRFGTAESIQSETPQQALSFGILVKLRADYLGQPLGELRDLRWARVRDLLGHAGTIKLEVLLNQMDELDTTADGMQLVKAISTLLESIADEPEEPPTPPEEDESQEESEPGSESESAGDTGGSEEEPSDTDDAGTDSGNGSSDADDGSDSSSSSSGDDATSDLDSTSDAADSSSTEGADNDPGQSGDGTGSGSGQETSAGPQDKPNRQAIRQALDEVVDPDNPGPSTDIGDAIAESLQESAEEAVSQAGAGTTNDQMSMHRIPRANGGEVEEVAQASKALRTRLASVMDARARTRVTHRSQGTRLDTAKVTRLFTGSTRVFVRKDYARKVNTAVQILLDRSTSMRDQGRIAVARKASLAAAMGISQIHGCKVAVACFPGIEVLKDFDEQVRGVTGRFVVDVDGCTPLGGAMLAVAPELARRQEQRKMLIVATDGDPDDPERVKQLVKLYAQSGVEVVGVGIQSDAVRGLFPSWTVIDKVEDLSTSLFNIVKDKLKRVA